MPLGAVRFGVIPLLTTGISALSAKDCPSDGLVAVIPAMLPIIMAAVALYHRWKDACRRVGVPPHILHDFSGRRCRT